MKIKKIIFIIVLLIFAFSSLNLNSVYAAKKYDEPWNDFYNRVSEAITSGKTKDLSDEDLQRMLDGPTKYDGYITQDLSWIQPEVQKIKDNRKQAEADPNKKEATEKSENMTNKEKKDKAEELRKKILEKTKNNTIDYEDLSKEEFEELKKMMAEYRTYSGTNVSSDNSMMSDIEGKLNAEYNERNPNNDTKTNSSMGKVDRDISHNLGEVISESKSFLNKANEEKIAQRDLEDLSDTIYSMLLVIAIVIAVILGVILGIKFITGGIEGQVDVKNALVPYIIGCVIVFGAFTIWKIIVDILQTM